MEWVFVVFAAVIYFTWQTLRTRCPACGVMILHTRDTTAEVAQRKKNELMKSRGLLNSLDAGGSALGSQMSKPSYANTRFICKSCDHHFTRGAAIEWLTIRNKLGEKHALAAYKDLE